MPICKPPHPCACFSLLPGKRVTGKTAFGNKGSALLAALFIMTLVAIAATAMTLRLQIDIHKTDLTIKSDKPYLASQLVVFWGIRTLSDPEKKFNRSDKDGSVARFPRKLRDNYPGIKLDGYILDMQGRFNLNNLRTKTGRSQFSRLMTSVHSDSESIDTKSITNAAWFWQNAYRLGRGKDKYMDIYLQQKPPLLPPQMPFVSISELRMVPGMNASLWQDLAPYITALPKPTGVNLNTASPRVLAILDNGLSESQVNNIIKTREEAPIGKSAASVKLLQELHLRKNDITLNSDYFMVVAIATQGTRRFVNYSLFDRKRDRRVKNRIRLSLIRESFNTL